MANEYELKNQMTENSRHIPIELLFQILVRLPVKSLTIYKSVCKQWRYMIESRPFIGAHKRSHCHDYSDQILFSPFKSVIDPVTKSSSLLPSTHSFCPDLVKMTSRPLDVMLPPEMTRLEWPDIELNGPIHKAWRASASILGPMRTTGIYCVVANVIWDSLPSAKISICNPATRDYKLVNPFPPEETAQLSGLAARHSIRVHYGFGLAADGDYKVVVVMNWGPKCSSFMSYVYSLKKSMWKKIVDSEKAMVSRLDVRGKPNFPDIVDLSCELCPQVFLNGCWHWMVVFQDYTFYVLSFDVDNEAFKLVRGPPTVVVSSSIVSVLNDHLTTLYHSYKSSSDNRGVISVWMMMDYGDEESWINVHTVDLVCSPIDTLIGISYSLRDDGNGIHIDKILFQDCRRQLVSCDKCGEVELQPGYDISSCVFWNTLGVSAYSETLERL